MIGEQTDCILNIISLNIIFITTLIDYSTEFVSKILNYIKNIEFNFNKIFSFYTINIRDSLLDSVDKNKIQISESNKEYFRFRDVNSNSETGVESSHKNIP
jgi:hypothetical protein